MSFEVVTHDIQISVFDSILVESTKVTGFNRPVERERERERERKYSVFFSFHRYLQFDDTSINIGLIHGYIGFMKDRPLAMEQWLKFISQLSKWSYVLTNIKVEVMNQTFY